MRHVWNWLGNPSCRWQCEHTKRYDTDAFTGPKQPARPQETGGIRQIGARFGKIRRRSISYGNRGFSISMLRRMLMISIQRSLLTCRKKPRSKLSFRGLPEEGLFSIIGMENCHWCGVGTVFKNYMLRLFLPICNCKH